MYLRYNTIEFIATKFYFPIQSANNSGFNETLFAIKAFMAFSKQYELLIIMAKRAWSGVVYIGYDDLSDNTLTWMLC